jgi:S-adenosylmethionine hydrolase
LGEDTGVFSILFGTENNWKSHQYEGDMLLCATEKLATMASWLFQDSYLENTTPYTSLKFQLSNLSEPDYNAERKTIFGKIAYIDSCCNAVTNIPVSMFNEIKKRSFKATIADAARPLVITRCHPYYNPKESEVYFVFNRLGFLEITLSGGNIAALADIKVGNNVEIQFL